MRIGRRKREKKKEEEEIEEEEQQGDQGQGYVLGRTDTVVAFN